MYKNTTAKEPIIAQIAFCLISSAMVGPTLDDCKIPIDFSEAPTVKSSKEVPSGKYFCSAVYNFC